MGPNVGEMAMAWDGDEGDVCELVEDVVGVVVFEVEDGDVKLFELESDVGIFEETEEEKIVSACNMKRRVH